MLFQFITQPSVEKKKDVFLKVQNNLGFCLSHSLCLILWKYNARRRRI